MSFDLKTAKRQAKALRASLADVANPAALTHAQCLDLLARMEGAANWSTFWARQHQTYFYLRHEPYLPNAAALVRALSVRKAVLADLSALAGEGEGTPPSARNPIALVTRALARFQKQASHARKGTLQVAPLLREALKRTSVDNLALLRAEEAQAEQAMARVLAGFESSLTGAPADYTDTQAKAYHAAYLAWRLATFAAAVCALRGQDPELRFAALATEGVDLFAYVGALLLGEAPARGPEHLERVRAKLAELHRMDAGRHARRRAQVLLMALLEGGGLEPSLLPPHEGLRFSASELAKSAQLLRDAFPEVVAWQAWVELKPLLAHGVDSAAERSRVF
jgi:hypothetical protein